MSLRPTKNQAELLVTLTWPRVFRTGGADAVRGKQHVESRVPDFGLQR